MSTWVESASVGGNRPSRDKSAIGAESRALAHQTIAQLPLEIGEEVLFSELRLRRLGAAWRYTCAPFGAEPDDIHLLLQMKGQSVASCGPKRVLLAQGDWLLCSGRTRLKVETADEVEQLLLVVPRRLIGCWELPASDFIAMSAASGGMGRVVACFVLSLAGNLPSIDCERHYGFAATTIQFISMTLAELLPKPRRPSLGETTAARIKAHVHKNIRNPDLSLESIAAAVGCTKRYLHKAFHAETATLNEFIWNSRLDHCRRELLDPANANWPLTAIAFSWGFNSAAHFSRAFRERFGASPSQMRKQGLTRGVTRDAKSVSVFRPSAAAQPDR